MKLDVYNQNVKKFESYDTALLSKLLDNDTVSQYTDNLTTLNTTLTTLIKSKSTYDINMALKTNKEKELVKYTEQYNTIISTILPTVNTTILPTSISNTIDSLLTSEDVKTLQTHVQTWTNIKQQLTALAKLPTPNTSDNILNITTSTSTSTSTSTYTLTDLQTALNTERTYLENDKLLKSIDLNHDQAEIDDYLDYINDILSHQDALRAKKDFESLPVITPYIYNTSIDTLQNDISNLLITQANLIAQLENTKIAQKGIQCPHCDKKVLYQNGALSKLDDITCTKQHIQQLEDTLQSTKSAILNLQHTLKTATQADHQAHQAYETYLEKKKQYEASYNPSQLTIIDASIPLLNNTEKNTIALNTIKEQLHHQEVNQKYNDILSSIDPLYLNTNPENLTILIKECQAFITQSKSKNDNINLLKNHINNINTDIKNIKNIITTDPSSDIENTKNKISTLNDDLSLHQQAVIIKTAYNALAVEREETISLTNKTKQLEQLKQTATSIECNMLNNIVNVVNASLNDVCTMLFPHDINIDLSLFKNKDKTTKKNKDSMNVIKPQVNFCINYKGGKYDNVNELSGGEADRVSLALTLALHRLSAFPFVMFDESLKSLDPELKQSVIDTIREHVHSTIAIIEHDLSESLVDLSINVENL